MLARVHSIVPWTAVLVLCATAAQGVSSGYARAAELATIRSNFTFVPHTPDPATPTPAAKASIVLLAGGQGVLALDASGQVTALQGNFLIRSAFRFMNVGLNVAMLDAPGPLNGLRLSAAHALYVAKAVEMVRKNWPKQKLVWLAGTSNGTISAFNLAARGATNAPPLKLASFPDGIVLASPVVQNALETVLGTTPPVATAKLKIPVLVVSHVADPCGPSDFAVSQKFYDTIISPKKEFFAVKTAMPAAAQAVCDAFSYHGFHGAEDLVVKKVIDFIQ